MTPFAITTYTATTAVGVGRRALLEALRAGRSGLTRCDFEGAALDCYIGPAPGLDTPLREQWAEWDCRNNRLAELALQQDDFSDVALAARQRYGAERIGTFIGTSTSGVLQTELAYRERDPETQTLPDWYVFDTTQSAFSIADFVRLRLDLAGPCVSLSAACASSAKAFAAAARSILAGFCDAAIVGGVDSLCLTTLFGFNSLQLLSKDVCRPADADRSGLSIGEAAAFALLERTSRPGMLALRGWGESSDAHHMSQPRPDGAGAIQAMRAALAAARLDPHAIDYVNLHGTATPANDLAEDRAMGALFGARVPCSSTKGWTGHTLGAAGMVEAAISLLCIEHGLLPRSLNTRRKDPALNSNILMETREAPVRNVMSNSFGFGGVNCSLVLGRLS